MQIFSAGQTNGTDGTDQQKVVQEVLADIKIENKVVINSNVSLEPKFQVTLDHSNLHIQLCAQLLTSKSGIVFLGHKEILIEKFF